MTLRRPVFGGNWKMHHGPRATREFVDAFAESLSPQDDRTIVIFPPSISLTTFVSAAADRPDLRAGAQDVYWEREGAFTGAISATMAREAGAEFSLAGHSERRHVFGDDDRDVARKMKAIVAEGLRPVLCVGETLDERDAGEVESVVGRQLRTGLEPLEDDQVRDVVIAYEPVWAIGTGRTAEPGDANEVHELIRGLLDDRLGGEGALVPILYGGSVKPHNIEELLAEPEIDGVLVGGASLDPESFAAICRAGGR